MSSSHSAATTRILVVVSDAATRREWTRSLRNLDFIVSSTADSVGAEVLLESFLPDIVVLDIDLPWRQYVGDPINAVLRRTHAWLVVGTPSHSTTEHQRLREIGAHQVIPMSSSSGQLLEALTPFIGVKRDAPEAEPAAPLLMSVASAVPITGQAQFGSLTLDMDQRTVRVDGKEVPLTRIEFDLLAELCRKPRGISMRRDLLVSVWGQPSDGDAHIVDVHLSNMRRKLSAAKPGTRFVQTVRGMGFRLADTLLQNNRTEGLRVGNGSTTSQEYTPSSHHWPASTAAR